ncbi:MAG: DUF3955 domain-containing protein [Opitutia bacterium]|jgi:hypothetical protein
MSNLPKALVAGLVCLGLAAACFVAKALAGSRVDAEGILREPFALIPLGWLLAFCGLVLLAVGILRRR